MLDINANQSGQSKLLQNIHIADKRELYKSYMSFIKTGALFIPFSDELSPAKISLGQNIFIVLTLLDSVKKYPIPGKIVWISRSGAIKGFGFAFGESSQSKILKDHIENLIIDFKMKKEPTYTF